MHKKKKKEFDFLQVFNDFVDLKPSEAMEKHGHKPKIQPKNEQTAHERGEYLLKFDFNG
jgi:hypothetical protein